MMTVIFIMVHDNDDDDDYDDYDDTIPEDTSLLI